MIAYQIEKWETFYPDCAPLLKEHETEVGECHPEMPIDPDIDTIAAMDRLGMVQIVTARDQGALIGYCIFTIANSLLSKTVLCATQSLYFVTQGARKWSGAGTKLYDESIRHLKERGVKNIYPHHYLRGDSAKLAIFFKRRGAVELQHEYSLWIGG